MYGDAEYVEEMFREFCHGARHRHSLSTRRPGFLFKDFLQPITISWRSLCPSAEQCWRSCYNGARTFVDDRRIDADDKNSILLVDFAIEGRKRGLSMRDALIEAGRMRRHPIVMTTVAMSAGMGSAAFGIGADTGLRAPMAVAVIGGLIASTLLSLVFVPVAFTAVEDVGAWLAGRLSRMTSVTN